MEPVLTEYYNISAHNLYTFSSYVPMFMTATNTYGNFEYFYSVSELENNEIITEKSICPSLYCFVLIQTEKYYGNTYFHVMSLENIDEGKIQFVKEIYLEQRIKTNIRDLLYIEKQCKTYENIYILNPERFRHDEIHKGSYSNFISERRIDNISLKSYINTHKTEKTEKSYKDLIQFVGYGTLTKKSFVKVVNNNFVIIYENDGKIFNIEFLGNGHVGWVYTSVNRHAAGTDVLNNVYQICKLFNIQVVI
jgi:hypothetical protein